MAEVGHYYPPPVIISGRLFFLQRITLCICGAVRPTKWSDLIHIKTKCSILDPRLPHYIFDLERSKVKVMQATNVKMPKSVLAVTPAINVPIYFE